jgi:hypothetical protein
MALLLPACGKLYIPPAPPDYADDCTPSDSFYNDKAASTRDIEWALDIPDEPAKALAYCEDLLTERGWQMVKKGADPGSQWGKFSTTLPSELPVLLLGADWDSKSTASKAITMCHEVVHTFQWERETARVFAPTYILNEGTFAYEIPAYRVSLWVWSSFTPSVTPQELERKARGYVDSLFTNYKLDNNLPPCMKETGVSIMLEGMD